MIGTNRLKVAMEDVHIIEVTEEKPERCQPLCDALMQFQVEKSKLHREILAAMNFENRLKASFFLLKTNYSS